MTLAQDAVARLTVAGRTVAVAESLTAGLVCAALADVPGASAVLRGGLVVYATDLKATLAGVDEGVLAEHGPVSAPVAEALARGVRRRCVADLGLALTGVAGPDPVDGHPPGTVHLGWATATGAGSQRLALTGDRAQVRAGAVEAALRRLVALAGPAG